MIEYITESEFEKRFEQWSKNRQPAQDSLVAHFQSRIESNSKVLAYAMIENNCLKTMRGMFKEAKWASLRAEFNKTFVPHPTGADRNAIAFCGDWRAKP